MGSILRPFIALYAASLLVTMGAALLATFLSLRLSIEGFSTITTGFILTSYFVGIIAGTFCSTYFIRKVGHIRSFCAFAALATAMVMLHGCTLSAIAWTVFRFFTGLSVIGLFMVLESWLNECTQSHNRGKVFSMYMVMCYLGGSLGQKALSLGDPKGHSLFFIIGILLISCILPIALTHTIRPQMPEVKSIHLKTIFRKAPMGILGCFTAGLINASFYTMGPVFCHQINLDMSQISYFMSITILGGLLLQWPVGIISDRFDRSKVMPILGGFFSILSLFMIFLDPEIPFHYILAATLIFGGSMFTFYPTAVARAHDMFEPKDVVKVSSALLLSYGIGAVIGPVVSSAFMDFLNTPSGLYIYFTMVSALFTAAAVFLRHMEMVKVIPVKEQVDFVIMEQTTQVAMQIDPRHEPPDDLPQSDDTREQKDKPETEKNQEA